MVGDGGLFQVQQLGQFLDAALAFAQQAHDPQAALVGQGLEEGQQGLDVGFGHDGSIRI